MDVVLGHGPSARTVRMDVPRFTLVGETRHTDLPMKKPFSDMFGFNARFDYYSLEDLKKIVVRTATILKVPITLGGAEVIANRSHGIPRDANQLVLHVRDYAEVNSDGTIDEATVRVALN